jgi:hypothetical protein
LDCLAFNEGYCLKAAKGYTSAAFVFSTNVMHSLLWLLHWFLSGYAQLYPCAIPDANAHWMQ